MGVSTNLHAPVQGMRLYQKECTIAPPRGSLVLGDVRPSGPKPKPDALSRPPPPRVWMGEKPEEPLDHAAPQLVLLRGLQLHQEVA